MTQTASKIGSFARMVLRFLLIFTVVAAGLSESAFLPEEPPPKAASASSTDHSHSFADKVTESWREAKEESDDVEFKKKQRVMKDDMPEFCRGVYMTMFMDGFHWTLLKRPSPQCLNYFVRSWRLENASKFKGAMLFTFLLAVLVEALSAMRGSIVRNMKRQQHVVLTVIYGIQALLGYILMLVTMSFSIELVLSLILGLMMGNLFFMKYEKLTVRNTPNNSRQEEDAEESRALLVVNGNLRRRA